MTSHSERWPLNHQWSFGVFCPKMYLLLANQFFSPPVKSSKWSIIFFCSTLQICLFASISLLGQPESTPDPEAGPKDILMLAYTDISSGGFFPSSWWGLTLGTLGSQELWGLIQSYLCSSVRRLKLRNLIRVLNQVQCGCWLTRFLNYCIKK